MTLAQQTSAEPEGPELLQTHEGQWVAYHGSNRLGFSADKTSLCRELLEKYPEHEILVRKIEADVGDVDMTC